MKTKFENIMCCELDGASVVFMLADEIQEVPNPLGHCSEWEEQFSDKCDASYADAWDEYFTSSEWDNPIYP